MSIKQLQFSAITFALTFLFNMGNLHSQDQYFSNETVWTTLSSSFGIPNPQEYTVTCGDTLINTMRYTKVYELRSSSNGAYLATYAYAMREEGQKIWRLKGDSEKLLYDFGLAEGETFVIDENGFPITLTVASVSNEMIHGVLRKKIQFQNLNGFLGETWYEGVGSSRGFSLRGTGYNTDGGTWLCCMKVGSELIFPNEPSTNCDCTAGNFSDFGMTCATTTSTKNLMSNNSRIKLFPNPSNGNITIQLDADVPQSIEFYKVTGKLVGIEKIQQREELNLSAFQKGVYFVKIIDLATNQFHLRKLVLN